MHMNKVLIMSCPKIDMVTSGGVAIRTSPDSGATGNMAREKETRANDQRENSRLKAAVEEMSSKLATLEEVETHLQETSDSAPQSQPHFLVVVLLMFRFSIL